MSSKRSNAKRSKHKPGPARAGNLQSASARAAALEQAGKLQNAGELPRAAAIYRELLAVEPHNDRALFLLGLLEHQRGDQQAARNRFERLLRLVNAADYRLWYARVLQAAGETQQALVEVRRSRELNPKLESAYHTESVLLRKLGQPAEALELLLVGLMAVPHSALLHTNVAETYLTLGDPANARLALERALEIDGGLCTAWILLGIALQATGQTPASKLAFEQALRLEPTNAEAHYNFGATLENNDEFERSLAEVSRAVELDPQRGEWLTGLAGLWTTLGEFDVALRCYRRGLELHPNMREHGSLLALQQYVPSEAEERLPEARRWAALHFPGASAPAQRRITRGSGEPLRVGYVSADFREHSLCYFFEPLLRAHDPRRVTVTCYSNSDKSDAVTERLAQHARIRPIAELSAEQVAELVRSDDIDVLVDLSGHTIGHRLDVFAKGCAPVQLSYLGYPGTTGLPTIQYRLTDALVDPAPLADSRYSETLVRLPRVFCCYQPPLAAPDVTALPALTRGHITFGSLNTYNKITSSVLRLWSSVLASVPNSRLLLQSRVFCDAAARSRVHERLLQHGVDPQRVELRGTMVLAEHLSLYHQIDIGLDTHPWNGHTTTCLALYMGVPVITLAGDVGASRMGVSVLTAAGLSEWVARDEGAYVSAAQRWANDLNGLAALRAGMRVQLRASALCDATSLAREVEDAYFALASAQASRVA